MPVPELGSLEPVNVRNIWEHEAHDFTPWLADNLDRLGTELGMNLELVATEVSTGPFYLDILARESDLEVNVAIENQLGGSDHGHLGQLLTYAAGHDARILIWVALGFEDAHREALSYLNRLLPGQLEIYAVEIRAWRIGESLYAPDFRQVVSPETRFERAAANLSSTRTTTPNRFALFYRPLITRLRQQGILPIGPRNGGFTGRWRSFPAGYDGIVYVTGIGTGGDDLTTAVYLQIMTDNRQQICQSLCGHQNEIQNELEGTEVEVWEADSACGLSISTEASVDDSEEKREATRTWLLEHLAHFKAAVQPRLDQVMTALPNLEPAEDPAPTEVISSG